MTLSIIPREPREPDAASSFADSSLSCDRGQSSSSHLTDSLLARRDELETIVNQLVVIRLGSRIPDRAAGMQMQREWVAGILLRADTADAAALIRLNRRELTRIGILYGNLKSREVVRIFASDPAWKVALRIAREMNSANLKNWYCSYNKNSLKRKN